MFHVKRMTIWVGPFWPHAHNVDTLSRGLVFSSQNGLSLSTIKER